MSTLTGAIVRESLAFGEPRPREGHGQQRRGRDTFSRPVRKTSISAFDVLTIWQYNYSMQFEWDENKRLINIQKHGIDFADVPSIFEHNIVTVIDDRFEYGETRYQTLGLLNSRVIMVVHAESETVIRIISARKANKREEKSYFSQIAD